MSPAGQTAGPAGPSSHGQGRRATDRGAGPRAGITALWALVLDRFRDHLHGIAIVADDPGLRPGGTYDKDT
jgi:hypothetical protein